MLDIKYIREHKKEVEMVARNKNTEVDVGLLLKLDEKRREIIRLSDDARAHQNRISDEIAKMTGSQRDNNIAQMRELKEEIKKQEEELHAIDGQYMMLLKQIPNIPSADVPVGKTEDENIVVKEVGKKPKFDFEPKNHWELAEGAGLIDKKRAANVAGARFAYIKGDLVRLQIAIVQFVIQTLGDETILSQIIKENKLDVSSNPFVPVLPPLMIKTEPYDAMDRLEPRDDRYKIEGEELWLQGSAEHVLGTMHMEEIFEEEDMPIRYLGYATSFRKEAGTYGKDMEGIIRMHQFDKLEMETFSIPEKAMDEHFLMVAIQEYLMQTLKLSYRVVKKCTADIGKPNARGIDIDVWLPGQNGYKETHTADYMTDYQARRLNTRVRRSEGHLDFVHTNDATAFAIGRIMVAIIENYQTKEGNVVIPDALRPYCSVEMISMSLS
ncbi:MAG: serine--tRNA ligase [bacterium]|nr:serine--tRNA ligase [bacterium]